MKIFIDTAPFIYIIEDNQEFANYSITMIATALSQQDTLVTSVITIMEFGVKPEKESREDVLLMFDELLKKLHFEIEPINLTIAKKAYKLRAKYQFLKGLDALQLACAIHAECEEFVTNDFKLKGVEEIKVRLMKEYHE